VTPEPAFFTIDQGTATTAAAVVGRLGGRWRLLAAGSVPAGIAEDILLEDLVARVRRADSSLIPGVGNADSPAGTAEWREWQRVRSRTSPAPPLALAAGSERSLAAVEPAFANAGWRIVARLTPDRLDAIAATELLLAGGAISIVLAGGPDDGSGLPEIAALIGAAIGGRPDVHVLLVGPAAGGIGLPPGPRVSRLPAPMRPSASAVRASAEVDDLAARALRLGLEAGDPQAMREPMESAADAGGPPVDGRTAFARGVASLAVVLGLVVDGFDVGFEAGMRVFATRDGVERAVTRADGALLPVSRRDALARAGVARDDERVLDGILGWSPLRDEGEVVRDRLRNMRLAPWRDAAGDGARLRLAAARAALSRLDAAWTSDGIDAAAVSVGRDVPDLLVASGGCFASAPPPAVALALIDAIRRPGAIVLALDHARMLAPLGSLPDEGDRRRLLADLADDILLPLGGAILVPGLRAGRRATLRITSDGTTSEIALHAGAVQVVDLPPGLVASAEVEAAEEFWVGVRARRAAFPVTGGLGGLLIDTRDVPLRLPERPDRRREVLDAWQRPLWVGGDA
jgi:hypothetical protein